MTVHESAAPELMRQGERILALQVQRQELLDRRTAELLRLTVATLGGVVVVSGLLLSVDRRLEESVLIALSAGVFCLTVAALLLARLVVGRPQDHAFAFGPDLRLVLAERRPEEVSRVDLEWSIVEAMPDWIDDNTSILGRQRRSKMAALAWLAVGSACVLLALLFIVGGHILG